MAWQFAPGEILTATNLNAVTVPWNAVCQVRMSTPQSLTNNTITQLLYDTEDLDPRSWHSTSVNTGRITPTIAGWYEAFVSGVLAADSDYTTMFVQFQKNGADLTPQRALNIAAPAGTFVPILNATSGLISMNGTTDYIDSTARQVNTSAAANTIDALLKVRLVYPT